MTHKDLNLVLDQRPPQQPAGARQPPPREVPAANKKPAGGAGRDRTAKNRQSNATGPRRQGLPIAAVLLITLVNTLFILAAGYWLSLRLDQQAAAITSTGPQANPRVELALATLGEDMLRLEARVQDLQSAVQANRQQAAAAYLELENYLKNRDAEAETAKPPAAPAAAAAEADNWIINAGTFSSRAEAERMQTRIRGLGHEARLHGNGADERGIYRLHISGYTDRASAEQAAQTIMGKTRLNGLWVSKEQ